MISPDPITTLVTATIAAAVGGGYVRARKAPAEIRLTESQATAEDVDTLRDIIAEHREEKRELRRSLAEFRQEVGRLSDENRKLRETVTHLKQVAAENESLRERIEALEAQVHT